MIEIKFIKTTSCPICGNTTVVFESVEREFGSAKIREHCSGGRWETRKFSCGFETRYCPNFVKEEKHGECMNDPTIKERDKKRKIALDDILEKIYRLDCDDEFKTRLSNKIN